MSDSKTIVSKFREAIYHSFAISSNALSDTDNLFEIGLDSMFLMRMVNQFRRAGCNITLKEMYEHPTLAEIQTLVEIKQGASPKGNTVKPEKTPCPIMTDGSPFPMTSVQLAYYIGRDESQPLGGNSCHLYQEFNAYSLDPKRLETAVNTLINRHPMLSVAFQDNGMQRWVAPIGTYQVTRHDFTALSESGAECEMKSIRDRLSHRVLDVQNGQTIDIHISLLHEHKSRVHVSIDLLVMDASSFSLFFNELSALLKGEPLQHRSPDYDFRSYLHQESTEFATQKRRSARFWQSQWETLPAAPNLPLAKEPAHVNKPRFSRRRHPLHQTQWQQLQALASCNQVTPTMVLATLYSAVMSRWSGQSKLLLNLTLFDCHPFNDHVNTMLADFTNILLLDSEINGANVIDLIKAHQHRFAELYEHRMISGVEVLRDLKKNGTHPHGAPIVFTSNLNKSLFGDDTDGPLGEPGWGISQTPQVWLDFVAFKQGDGIILQWDGIDELFPDGLMETMFHTFVQLIEHLLEGNQHWHAPLPDLQPKTQRSIRSKLNQLQGELPPGLLHDRIFEQASLHPSRIAVISSGEQLSYDALTIKARKLAHLLVEANMQSGDHVAVSMEKGTGQIVAVLAILYAGGVYVPIAPNQPISRRKSIVANANIRIVLRCKTAIIQFEWTDSIHINWQDAKGATLPLSAPLRRPEDTAYIIYTSGSTGTPKGVMISHQSALNTCVDINDRHKVSPNDRVLALSALHFDLSVYDIFGVLAAGGALVLPQENQLRDPMTWDSLVSEHQITLWNTVPALFNMFLTFCEGMKFNSPSLLRTVMLSGDWIDLSLPERYRHFQPEGTFSAMGGATEAAIWSNEYLVDETDPHWRSVPYGYPLKNQAFRVVDDTGRDCPDWVQGELWIGGSGVAQGYWNDNQRTSQQFIERVCPETGAPQRWYRTGDTGCYWPDGTLEFLGRKDNQVKVGGYRIELGEIDAALNRLDGISQGMVLALSQAASKDKQLEGFVVTEGVELLSIVEPHPSLPNNYQTLFRQGVDAKAAEQDADVGGFLHQHLSTCVADSLTPKSLKEWLQSYGVIERYTELFEKWLALLCQHNLADKHENGRYPTYQLAPEVPNRSWLLDHSPTNLVKLNQLFRQIITGKTPAYALLDSPLSPESLLMGSPTLQMLIAKTIGAVSRLSAKLGKPITVVETESRSGLLASQFATLLGPDKIQYHAVDPSLSMTHQASSRLKRLTHAKARHDGAAITAMMANKADVLLLNNVLHRQQDPIDYLNDVKTLLAPGGMMLVFEVTEFGEGALISAQVLEAVQPQRLAGAILEASFEQAGFSLEHQDIVGNHALYVLKNNNALMKPDTRKLLTRLSELLPAYMLPKRFTFMDALPLTPNGKVNRKCLSEHNTGSSITPPEAQPLLSEKETILGQVWQSLFNQAALDKNSDFFLLGGDSLLATRCIGELQKVGFQGDLTELFTKTTLGEFAATLKPADPSHQLDNKALIARSKDRYLPFPLTEVQQAYWIGRQKGFALGETSSQFFIEFRVQGLDVHRFNQAMDKLIERHDMLRAVVRNHQQQVLRDVPSFSLRCHMFDDLDCAKADDIRNELSHQVKNPAYWPLFSIEAIKDTAHETRLFVSLDNMMLDGLSMQIFLSELETFYQDPLAQLPELDISFRDYIKHQKDHEHSNKHAQKEGKTYWKNQLATLPPAPNLPIQSDPAELSKPKFIRSADTLSPTLWRALKEMAARHQITPSAILMCAYASTLSAWSDKQSLTLNLTLFDRQEIHPQINQVMGDFTTLLLLAWHPENSWLSSLKRLQGQLVQDLKHRDVSAVWVMRELARQQNIANTSMPVVFTSALGTSDGDFIADSAWFKPAWGISQTPQVWLDHQVYESSGYLCLNWDAVETLLPQPLLDQMFGQYIQLLKTLAANPECWQMPVEQLIVADKNLTRFAPEPTPPAFSPMWAGGTHCDPATVNQIRETFNQLLSTPIGEKDNFFDAGASSLQLIQLHGALHKKGMNISVTDLFAYPSPESLAAAVSGAAKTSQPDHTLQARQQRQANRKISRRQRVK
ncbi:amino acid adenylation enzyme/thioester reductase family protein [Shewanella psychrophila]|uniref:Amino acid adenylation enzyme/thioester reductase family protein n=1 Tax=Shewanella psychrophila TaxID=225848 RepID=A0A1S6HN45_9GAMM|nr:non-ribosomal peptide synthetase [Shewanella psychrophila]AQS36929.1 amino acid adenylation enzyme/thioester reductase family protein [Shewanella psychrophila]